MAVRSNAVCGASVENATVARPLRVLLIEDSLLIREAVAELIESDGCAYVAAAADSESAAIGALQDNTFDVVIVDLKLREGSGFGVLRVLRESKPGMLVIVFTNYATPAIRKRCAELGAAWFFDKSSDVEAIGELIARHAAQRRLS